MCTHRHCLQTQWSAMHEWVSIGYDVFIIEAWIWLDARNHWTGGQLVLLGLPGHSDTWRLPGVEVSSQQVNSVNGRIIHNIMNQKYLVCTLSSNLTIAYNLLSLIFNDVRQVTLAYCTVCNCEPMYNLANVCSIFSARCIR